VGTSKLEKWGLGDLKEERKRKKKKGSIESVVEKKMQGAGRGEGKGAKKGERRKISRKKMNKARSLGGEIFSLPRRKRKTGGGTGIIGIKKGSMVGKRKALHRCFPLRL